MATPIPPRQWGAARDPQGPTAFLEAIPVGGDALMPASFNLKTVRGLAYRTSENGRRYVFRRLPEGVRIWRTA